MRYFQSLLVVAIILLSSSVFAQSELSPPEPQIVSDSVGPEAEPAPVMSEPDYRVLRRIKSFRGPYSDQDDPILKQAQQKETARTGIDRAKFVCRPPACSRDAGSLIVKLATPTQSAHLSKSLGSAAKQSPLLDNNPMTPTFQQQLVANAVAKYRTINAKQKGGGVAMPTNSLGKPVDLTRWRKLSLPAGTDLDDAIEELELDPRVEVVEATFERTLKGGEVEKQSGFGGGVSALVVADDPRKGEQWALGSAKVEEAWEYLESSGHPAWGNRNIVVAVIDSGVDYTHEDLAGNMWVNAGEIPDNGQDDDNNGFVDDVYGADVVGSLYDHDGDPQDDNGHGTHVAGIIAAQGNNGIGIIGVAPNAQIMAIKAAQYSGRLTSTDISEAILYAYQQGADIINMSFGGSGRSVLEEEALAVAFSNAVLVASAGNSGYYNDPACGNQPSPSYPAAHPYVLGVMAESPSSNPEGGYLAAFSNWDCTPRNGLEYEVMAPGVDILSTVPGDSYATWDGTSMAAPIVAGIAALVRTTFDDKGKYSSRFIMGQVGSTGGSKPGLKPCKTCPMKSFLSADALEALTDVPNPSLSYLAHYVFDGATQGPSNDEDGIVDAGETIELALVLKNHWGMADNVQVTLAAKTRGAVNLDPYVTWDTASVNYGGVGSFNEDDNGLIYDDGLITGVNSPFRFTVSPETPNEHIIPILVTMEADNGLDPSDSGTYTTTSSFNLIVQRGRELPSVIGSDSAGTPGGNLDTDGIENGIVTLDDSALWLVEQPVLVSQGAHLKIGPGAIVQFGANQASDVYAANQRVYLQYDGVLEVAGTAKQPVTLKASELLNRWAVRIGRCPSNDCGQNVGTATFSYAKLFNPVIDANSFDHVEVIRRDTSEALCYNVSGQGNCGERNPVLENTRDYNDENRVSITNSRFKRVGQEERYVTDPSYQYINRFEIPDAGIFSGNLIENTPLVVPEAFNAAGSGGNVLLSINHRYVNFYGNYITTGSVWDARAPKSTNARVIASTSISGRTYAWIHARPISDWDSQPAVEMVDQVRAFAQSVGGDLFIPSDDSESDAVYAWLNQAQRSIDGNFRSAEELSNALDIDCGTWLEACYEFSSYYFVIGAEHSADLGKWVWMNGETPDLSYDPLEQQFIQDRFVNRDFGYYVTDVGCTEWQCPYGNLWGYDAVLVEIPAEVSNQWLQEMLAGYWDGRGSGGSANVILSHFWDPNIYHWLRVETPAYSGADRFFNASIDLTGVYWGGASEDVVRKGIEDLSANFNKTPAKLSPLMEHAPENVYPFMASLELLDTEGNTRSDLRFSSEPLVWRLKFNRDMDQGVQPFVTFGPDEPYTDFIVPGDWVDDRIWEGRVTISPVATDGYQYVRVAGAVAADDPWLVTGVDKRRFRFEIITSGVESLNLQASGGEGFVDLSWNQDDYDTLLGFNVYRSTSPDSGFIRINQTLVGNGERSYRDTGVDPGVQYYYYFTVALDGSESDPSNTASATPIDTVKPILSHSVISTAPFGSTVLISANVTDNIGVQSVTLYYRAIGGGSYTAVNMANISGSTYRASIPASATQPPGVEYYIAATDGASFAYSGRSTSPNTITVENNPVVTGVTPNTGSSTGGDTITVTGNNFVSGASVLLGNATCQNVTLVDASRLTCVTPASAPELVAVKVINPDGGNGVLTSAFTFVGNSTTLSLPEFQANKGQTRDIALSIDPVSGLQSFSAVISFDNTHLTLGNIVPGPLASGWNFGYSMVDENTVNIQAFSGTRVSGAGKLAILEFLVIADGDAASVLDIESAQLNEGTIQAALVDGSFSIFPGYTLGGSVKYWDASQKPIEALLTLNDLQEQTSAADTGAYEFAGLLDQQHTIKIEKFDDIDDSIRAYDASLILSHVLGTQTLTGSALVSADVTGDGSVSTQDAAKIAEVAAGLSTVPFPNQASAWRFEPAERQFNSLTADFAAADFTGLFMGDVSGNWSGTGTASVNGLRLEVADMSRLDSGAIIAEVNAYAGSSLTPEAISAIELSLNTSSGVSLLSVEQTVATDTWTRPIIRADGGHLGFTLYGDVSGAFVGEAHVLTLRFSVADTYQQIERLAGHVNEKAVFDSKLMEIRLPDDQDGDLVRDDDDAFPNDAAASLDSDGDGAPDNWNPFATDAEIAASSLVIDAFPKDPDEWLDNDSDGVGNNKDNDDDGDGYTDVEELDADSDPTDSSSVPTMRSNILLFKAIIDASRVPKE
jgi:subtilisin family serine protease